MTTVVELSPDELSALQELTKESEPAAAVRAALPFFDIGADRCERKSQRFAVADRNSFEELAPFMEKFGRNALPRLRFGLR